MGINPEIPFKEATRDGLSPIADESAEMPTGAHVRGAG